MNLFNNQEGLTLIEILVSLTLLAVIITVFSGVFINGMFFENEVENRLRVSNLAASIIETMEYYSNEDEVEIFSELEENVEYSYPFSNSDTYNSAFKNFNDELDSMIQQKSQDIKNFKSVSITNRGLVSFEEDEGIENLYEFEIKITWAENNYQLTNRIYDSPLIANDNEDDDEDDDDDDDDEDDDEDDDYDDDDDEDDDYDDDDDDDYDDDDDEDDDDDDRDDDDRDDDDRDDDDRDDDDREDEDEDEDGSWWPWPPWFF